MINEAIKKINTEMQKRSTDAYVEIIGQYVIDRIVDDETAQKILVNEKTLNGAMSEVTKAAQKKKQGNVAVLLPAEVFGVIDQYFGLSRNDVAQLKAMQGNISNAAAEAVTKPVGVPVQKPKGKLSLNLGDFL